MKRHRKSPHPVRRGRRPRALSIESGVGLLELMLVMVLDHNVNFDVLFRSILDS